MRIQLNLATRPFADLGPAIKQLRIAMGVLAVLAIGLGVGLDLLHRKAEEARATEHKVEVRILAVNQEHQGYLNLMQQPANADVLAQAQSLNQLFDEKAFSWTLAMEDLETVLPGGVQVATLEPVRDTKTGIITLHLHVLGPRDRAVELVKNLEHSRRFLSPRIVGENAESANGNNQQAEPVSASNRVNFEVWANYNPADETERRTTRAKVTPVADSLNTANQPAQRIVPAAPKMPVQPQRLDRPMQRPLAPAVPSPMPMGAPGTRTPYKGPGPDANDPRLRPNRNLHPVQQPAPDAGGPQ
jgi:type IV pilus assembly protein PilN